MAETEPSWPATAQRLRLGEIEVDLRYRRVQRAGATQELNPRCFDLLLLFLREPQVVHARDEIFRKVWPGVIVEDASLSTSIWQLRRALGGQAKQWIRTVSKQGYIFDPPPSVRLEVLPAESRGVGSAATADAANAMQDTALVDDAPHGAVAMPAPVTVSPTTVATRRGVWLKGSAIAVAVALLLVAGAFYRRHNAPSPRVELVAQFDPSASAQARWPTELLQAWLEWQLRAQPGIELSTATDETHGANALVLMLSVDMPTPGNDAWRIAARFHGPDAPPDIVQRISGDNLVAGLDEVARAALAALPSQASGSARPELALNKPAAIKLVAGLQAERGQRWSEAIVAYQQVIDESQSFGFARVHLARCQSELGQVGSAQVELGRAQAWVAALSPTLRQPFEAQEALIRQNFARAAVAYAALQKQSDTAAYRVAEATALRRDGHVREAAEALSGEAPMAPSQAVPWLLERAAIEAANRDNVHGSASASAARELAQQLGWDHSYARATLQLTELQAASGKPVDAGLFEQARQAFERAGDKLGVLRATLAQELQATTDAEPAHLDELLAEASQAGNSTVEIDALRRTAAFHIRHGELQRAHERYAQAAAVAQATGSAIERRDIDLLLLQEDFLRLDFAAMDQRLGRLRAEPMQGRIAFIVGLNAARLHYLRGDYPAALEEHERTVAALNAADDKNLSPFATVMVCLRATVATQQGRTAAARVDFRECRAIGEPSIVRFADLGEAELAIDTGDLAEARRLLAPMHDWLEHAENQQDRWSLSNGVTALLAPLGDFDEARKIIDEALPGASRSGYRLIEANLRDTLAQMALARGRIDEAEREATAAEALLPPEDWYEQRRVRSVRVGIALARGQREAATKLLSSLHEEARKHGDVLGELQAHGLADTAGLTMEGCTSERRNELLAQSGMRGANDGWIVPPANRVKGAAQ